MSNKLLNKSVLVGLILVLPLAIGSRVQSQDTSSPRADALPAEARYLILFRQLTSPPARNQSNDQSVPRPERPNFRAMFQRSARLNEDEARLLFLLAYECMQKVQELDQHASQIIATRRAQHKPGSDPGTPPAELSQLQQERDNAIRNAIERIRVGFGAEEFKRFDDYVMSQGSGMRALLPPRNQPALPIQVTITLLDPDGQAAMKQFAANDRVIIQVAMLNNSPQLIDVRASEVFGWLEVTSDQNRPLPFSLLLQLSGFNTDSESAESESAVTVPPAQLVIVGRTQIGPRGFKLKPSAYQINVHKKVLLNRPPNDSQFLELSVKEPVQFEIVP